MSGTFLSVLHINPHNSTTLKYDDDFYFRDDEIGAR